MRLAAPGTGQVEAGISLGQYEVHVTDQAVGYATFAAQGVAATPYVVAKVDRGGQTVWSARPQTRQALPADVTADATSAMQQVVTSGTGTRARLAGGRPAAGKTGTTDKSNNVWFVGFTPQLSTAVWFGYGDPGALGPRGQRQRLQRRCDQRPGVEGLHGCRADRRAGAEVPAARRRGRPAARAGPDVRPADDGAAVAHPDADADADAEPDAQRRAHLPDAHREPDAAHAQDPAPAPDDPAGDRGCPAHPRRHAAAVRGRVGGPTAAVTASPTTDPGAAAPGRAGLPSAEDPFVAGATGAIGGPPGRHARLGQPRRMTATRWLVVLALLTSALGLWQKAPCRVHPWDDEYQYTRACYTDVLALYYAERLDAGARPYLDHPVEYPVVIGAAMAVASRLAVPVADAWPGSRLGRARAAVQDAQSDPSRLAPARSELSAATTAARARAFYDLTWVLLTACALVVVLTTARLAGRRRVWDAALVAVAPGLLLHATTNWDLIAVALAGLGLLAWARSRPVLAGVLLGLGTATKLYPVLFLVPLLVLCWRTGRLRAGVTTALALAVAALAVTLPVYLVSPSYAEVGGAQVQVAAAPLARLADGPAALAPHTTAVSDGRLVVGVNSVWRFVELNQQRPADWDSLVYALQRTRGQLGGPLGPVYDGFAGLVLGPPGAPVGHLNAVVALGTAAVVLAVALLALAAPRRPRLPQLLFLTVSGFLLVNKVFSPQYVLWLLPLAALARPRWRPFLAWQAAEAGLLLARFYFFVSFPMGKDDQPVEGIDASWFLGAVVLRDLALVALAAAVVRDVLRPEVDVVRAGGLDDPAGGVLDGAPDRPRREDPAPLPA